MPVTKKKPTKKDLWIGIIEVIVAIIALNLLFWILKQGL
jgi:preprotein translocase subunit SecE